METNEKMPPKVLHWPYVISLRTWPLSFSP